MDIYKVMFISGLIVAGVFLILAIVLFFVLNIPKAFGIATGSTQRKAIEEIRAAGYESRTRSRRTRERIRAREAEMDSGQLGDTDSGDLGDQEAAVDKIEESAKKDAAEASAASGNRKLTGRRGKNKKLGLENERTEVLGYEEEEDSERYQPTSGDPAEATDVLGKNDNSGYLKKPEPRQNTTAFEDIETDVLSNEAIQNAFVAAASEEETALLSSEDAQAQSSQIPAEELTSVLQNPNAADGDIPLTTVLSDPTMKPEDLEIGEKKRIIVLLSETVVHTEESL